jgi:polyhydroxyalkanoate synthesis regulator phasin
MSEGTKEQVKEAHKFFQEVSEKSKQYQKSIPDKGLSEKLRKVEQSSEEVVKHIDERSEPKR